MKKILWCLFLAPFFCAAQKYTLKAQNELLGTSLRGLSIVNDQVAWVSGSNGCVGKTIDGGISWQWLKPKGYEKLDFRSVKAFNGQSAIVVNAGTPAYVLKTIDGGKTWQETYKNTDTAIFLDGLSFWEKNKGLIFGDPIDNRLKLLKTNDGGSKWTDVSAHLKQGLTPGEAGFAASGTTIKTLSDGKVWIATGGKVSNIYFSNDYAQNWTVFQCPIWQGESSTGVFSIDFYDAKNGAAVGGNYLKDQDNSNNVLLSNDGGKNWYKPNLPVFGYRSCVAYISAKTLIATGTTGTDLSVDGGKTWAHISDISFNVVQKSKSGKLILLAGNKGLIYKLDKL